MADLATSLLRTVVRAFYPTEHALVIDALALHSTLQDSDLAFVLGMPTKNARKYCGRLKEDGLLSVQARAERRTDGTNTYYGGANGQPGKERVTYKDWYYLNFHRAIDSIKYRMYKLNKHVEKLGAPSIEKKDYSCPRCKSQWAELDVIDKLDLKTAQFICPRRSCGALLDAVDEEERSSENESMKRLNSQLEKILRLLQQIDASNVPENDFQMALSKQRPIIRNEANPGQQRTEIVDLPGKNMQSTKGLDIKPEKIAVQVQDDETVKKESAAAEAQARKDREARQNALPDWIAKSTVSGEITAVGAKEERLRLEREGHSGTIKEEGDEEEKPDNGDEKIMDEYWAELAADKAKEAARAQAEEDEEDDEDEDENDFEDVNVSAGTPQPDGGTSTSAKRPAESVGPSAGAPGANSIAPEEREAKRTKVEESSSDKQSESKPASTGTSAIAEGTPAASDEDEDDLEFENV